MSEPIVTKEPTGWTYRAAEFWGTKHVAIVERLHEDCDIHLFDGMGSSLRDENDRKVWAIEVPMTLSIDDAKALYLALGKAISDYEGEEAKRRKGADR